MSVYQTDKWINCLHHSPISTSILFSILFLSAWSSEGICQSDTSQHSDSIGPVTGGIGGEGPGFDTNLLIQPGQSSGTVDLYTACTAVNLQNGQSVYIDDVATNGRWDDFDYAGLQPPGFFISFSLPTLSSGAFPVPTTSVEFSIDANSPSGHYTAFLVADRSYIDQKAAGYCYNRNNPNNDALAAYSGFFSYYVTSITSPAIKSSLSTFSFSVTPSNGYGGDWYPGDSDLLPVYLAADTEGELGGTVKQPTGCTDKGKQVAVCPIASVTPLTVTSSSGTFTLIPPPNPVPGQYNPGQLTGIDRGAALGNPVFPTERTNGQIGVAGTTYYVTSDEDTFEYPPNCGTLRYNGKLYSGVVPGSVAFPKNPEYASGMFCAAWVEYLVINGSGVFSNPKYTWAGTEFHFINSLVSGDTPLHGGDGLGSDDVLQPQQSIARDRTIIPISHPPYNVTVSGGSIGPGGASSFVVQAVDTGGAFMSKGANLGEGYDHFDLYEGITHTVTLPGGFSSPMVLFGCDVMPPLKGNRNLCPGTTMSFDALVPRRPSTNMKSLGRLAPRHQH